ncbi:response regulator transcription factor [Phenylobacterium sp.]|jgi:two-component system KDP operon response regulator KdpE|uniref:response regulator transcription factor n=1 Tax=Phenylobacterium sp. TaxID=1871053 RepID=UPI0035AE418E
MSADAKILIVEDEEQLVRMLRSSLVYAGYEVSAARTGREAISSLRTEPFDVVLLDLGLPDIDGQEVIETTRAFSNAPIIVVSARSSEKEKITALDHGANDYVAKPFDMGELLARIRVALRVGQSTGSAATRSGRLEIDFKRRQAIVDGEIIRLSGKEAQLLQLLAAAEGAVVGHDEIIETIWGRGSEADVMHLRVLTWQARRKIEPNPSSPRYLIAEPGVGYRLNLD